MNFILLLLSSAFSFDSSLLRQQAAPCSNLLYLFSDQAWLPATERLLEEWRYVRRSHDSCAVLWLWLRRNASEPSVCRTGALCHVEWYDQGAATAAWGTHEYFRRIGQRLPAVLAGLRALPENSESGLLVLDSDVVLRRNVGAWILARWSKGADLVFQQEWPCQTAPHTLCVNGGVWWSRRSAGAAVLIQSAVTLMHRLAVPEQDALQIVATRERNRVEFLDRALCPNGYTLLQTGASLARRHLVHVNWLRTQQCKLVALEQLRRHSEVGVGENCTIFKHSI